MIAKDEEGYIKDCLNAVKDFVDEIIIVDTGSTDNTQQLAKECGAQVQHLDWCDDFAAARNESLKYTTKDWILVLDADEVLAKKDLIKIKELIQSDEYDAYSLDQRSYTDNYTYAGWQPCDNYQECKASGFFITKIVRLFKRGPKFHGKVHESVENNIQGKIQDSKIPIHHYGHLKGEQSLTQKREKYLKLGLAQIEKTPNDPKPYYDAARIYKNTNQLLKAAEFFEKAEKLKPGYRAVYTNLADIYANLNQTDKAVEYYKKAIADKPKKRKYLYQFGFTVCQTKKTKRKL